jgi:spore germination protein GerM
MGKRRKKKSRTGILLLLFFLIGGVIFFSTLFRKEVSRRIEPFFQKLEVLKEKKEVVLYFSSQEGDYLVGEKRKISKRKELGEEAKELLGELAKGPSGRLIPTLPQRTKCLNVMVNEKGLAKVNFNHFLLKDHPGGSSAEILTAYSIVHSLTQNYPEIKKVQILVNGKPIETISGHLSLKNPLSPNPNLIKKP